MADDVVVVVDVLFAVVAVVVADFVLVVVVIVVVVAAIVAVAAVVVVVFFAVVAFVAVVVVVVVVALVACYFLKFCADSFPWLCTETCTATNAKCLKINDKNYTSLLTYKKYTYASHSLTRTCTTQTHANTHVHTPLLKNKLCLHARMCVFLCL